MFLDATFTLNNSEGLALKGTLGDTAGKQRHAPCSVWAMGKQSLPDPPPLLQQDHRVIKVSQGRAPREHGTAAPRGLGRKGPGAPTAAKRSLVFPSEDKHEAFGCCVSWPGP